MKVTRINPNTITVQLDPEQEPSVVTRRGPAASHINCGSAEVQRHLWDHLEHLAERPSFEDQLFEPSLAERIEALENADKCNDTAQKHCRELIRNLDTRLSALSTTCATDHRDHENRIDALEKAKEAKLDYEDLDLRVGTLKGDIERQDRRMAKLEELIELVRDDDDRLHDAIATYVMGKPNVLRRAIIDIITDKLC